MIVYLIRLLYFHTYQNKIQTMKYSVPLYIFYTQKGRRICKQASKREQKHSSLKGKRGKTMNFYSFRKNCLFECKFEFICTSTFLKSFSALRTSSIVYDYYLEQYSGTVI
jgi:hypothetical protein